MPVFNYLQWRKTAQEYSIPGHGPTNIPANDLQQLIAPGGGMPGNTGGTANGDSSLNFSGQPGGQQQQPVEQPNVDEQIDTVLQHVEHFQHGKQDVNTIKAEVTQLLNIIPKGDARYEGTAQRLFSMIQGMGPMSDANHPTSDPYTGKTYKTIQEQATELRNELESRSDRFEDQEQSGTTTMAKTYNHSKAMRLAQERELTPQEKTLVEDDEKDKKHGGNPFVVLMGMVETLLNPGASEADIVRHVKREGNWDEDLIRKAIHCVKETKEKEHNEQKLHPEQNIKHKHPKKETMEEAFHGHIPHSHGQFANTKIQKTAAREGTDTIYAVKPDYSKRSVGELMMRGRYLIGVQNYGPNQKQGDSRKAADKSGIASELKAIRSTLSTYGFSELEINKLLVGANTNPTADGFSNYKQDTK